MYPDARDEVVQLYLDDIIPNRFQPREVFDERALKELAVSIREHGVIQPIIVRSVPNGKYEIIAGERRYKASALAGLTKIPAIVRDLDDKESSKVALLENLQRKNLNPLEEARTYQKILEIDEMTQEELARTMGKSQSSVANKIRLLSLSEAAQEALLKEEISERHARTLLNVEDQIKQTELLKKVIETKMNVRQLEEEVKQYKETEEKEPPKEETIASSNAFVNDNPLMPTMEIKSNEDNYGKVTIAPPIGEDMPTGKFINYGEIGKEEDEEEDVNDLPPSPIDVNIEDIKNQTEDINKPNMSGGGDLDSLLNLGTPKPPKSNDKFMTTAEEIVRNDEEEDDTSFSSDYFKIPDASEMGMDSNMGTSEDSFSGNSLVPDLSFQDDEPENYSIEDAMKKINHLVEDLKNHGIKVTTNEMDFEKSYQMIIKIDKTEEE